MSANPEGESMKDADPERRRHGVKAYLKESFLNAADARPLRILAEYLEPKSRLARHRIEDTIVFMGSARLASREQGQGELDAGQAATLGPLSHPHLIPVLSSRAVENWNAVGMPFFGTATLDDVLSAP